MVSFSLRTSAHLTMPAIPTLSFTNQHPESGHAIVRLCPPRPPGHEAARAVRRRLLAHFDLSATEYIADSARAHLPTVYKTIQLYRDCQPMKWETRCNSKKSASNSCTAT